MISFDLRCGAGHVFEAWFRSSSDFEAQAVRKLIPCSLCGDTDVAKAVMAPNVTRKGNQLPSVRSVPEAAVPAVSSPSAPTLPSTPLPAAAGPLPPQLVAMAAALAAAQAETLPKSTWVGDAFATRARAMHQGDEDMALIHGQASREEVEALVDEGVPVMPLLVPVIPPELQN